MKSSFLALILLLTLPLAALADLDLPVKGVVTSGVGWRLDPFGTGKLAFHRGIDIAVPAGTPVRATRKGRVVFAGARRGYGSTVIVEHANGDRTLYGHNSQVAVTSGDLVESGTVVAYSGNTGRSTGPHVHYEQISSGRPVIEEVATLDLAISESDKSSNQRYLLEQKMEESLNSILKTIRAGSAGQGG
jgi:murein DD-endopeptidase MepM/ murein hydrolase activator NlpD